MAIEKVKLFMGMIRKNEELQKEIQENIQGKEMDEVIRYYAGLADRLDFDVTEEDLRAALAGEEKLRARTDAAIEQVEELSLDELEAVAGGMHDKCANTYTDRENCILLDGCDMVIFPYDKYLCLHNDNGAHCGSAATQDCESLIW